jgi:hypothetical protein
MNNVRLVCGGYSVDLPTDFGIQINKSIADIREPESRSSDWTKTFTLPGTKTNNKLFTHLFDLNLSIRNTTSTNFSPDFNPNLKADALLTVDEVTQIEGFIRLLSIKVNDLNQIEYECSMHGELADLFAKISDAKLADLDFTEYNHILNATNIFNSWDTSIVKNGSSGYVNFSGGAPTGEGYVYGWTDNGTYANYQNLNVDSMTVYMYAKTVVDKIFSGAGYSYSSGSFFNTAQFKRLVVPCPTRFPILGEDDIALREFEVERSTDVTIAKNGTLIFNNEIYDNSNQYNNTTGIYTCQYSGEYNIFIDNNATLSGLAANQVFFAIYVIYVNGKLTYDGISERGIANAAGNATINQRVDFYNLYLNKNDTVEIKLFDIFDYTLKVPLTGWTYTQKTGSILYNEVRPTTWGYDQTIDFGGFFQDETKQRDFMKWIFTLFNLYIEPTEINKQLVVLPREDFYTSTVQDWTEKRDLSQPLDITPMGELDAGKYLFTYAEGDDEDNKSYKQDFDRIYGDRQIIINNDFIKEEKKVEIGFQPTTIISVGFDDKYLPGNSTDNQDGKAGKLRLLQYKYLSCKTYTIYYGKSTPVSSPTTTTKTNYPYMGHLDDPLASTTDINFGLPRYIGLPGGTPVTNNNTYNAYWSKYISEITDKDSKIVRGNFYLTPADMEKLSFRDLYFFDGNYFRLNKIEDYDPINPSVNICEFLFLKTGPTFTATTGSVGGGGTQSSGGSGQTEYDPYDGSNLPGRVIQNKGFSIGQYNDAGSGVMIGNAITNFGNRNAAFATSGVTFLCDDSIVIGEAPAEPVGCNEVWIQGQQITPNNFNSNRFVYPAGNYTMALHDDIIISLGTGNHTLTLPQASTATGKMYWVVKKGAQGTLTIDAYSDELIDGAANYTINNQYGTACLVCDGTEWYALTNK